MKRFAFRLESVLRLRRFELERARVQLETLEAERRRREARVVGEEKALARGHALLTEGIEAGVDGERLSLHADGIASGRLRKAHAERAVEDLSEVLGEARRRLTHARSRVRSLEKLKDRRAAEHRRAGLAAEQAELEELAMARVSSARRGTKSGLRENAS